MKKFCEKEWLDFYNEYKEAFEKAPAGQRHHHNFAGGLAVHTAEVIRAMFEIRDHLSRNTIASSGQELSVANSEFADRDIVISAFLHDFAKIKQYVEDENGDWFYTEMSMPQETWTLMVLAQHGLKVTEEQTLALLFAEGGFSIFTTHGRPNHLAWLLHMADIWSSQIICPIVRPPSCPRCGKDMRKKNGIKGLFWGCSGYPNCKMTVNIEG